MDHTLDIMTTEDEATDYGTAMNMAEAGDFEPTKAAPPELLENALVPPNTNKVKQANLAAQIRIATEQEDAIDKNQGESVEGHWAQLDR